LSIATTITLVVATATGIVTFNPEAAAMMAAGILAMGAGGLGVWWRRPGSVAGPLLVVLAIYLQLSAWRGFPNGAIAAVGAFAWLAGALVPAHLLLTHPDGLPGRRWRRCVVVGCYVLPAVLALIIVMTSDSRRVVTWEPYSRAAEVIDPATVDDVALAPLDEPGNPFAVADAPGVARLADATHQVLIGAVALATAVVLVDRYRRAGRALRRSSAAVTAAGLAWAAVALFPRSAATSAGTWLREAAQRLTTVGGAVVILLPVLSVLVLGGAVIYVELIRPRLDRTAAGALALAVGGAPGERLQAALARSLDDPSVELRFRRAEGWVSTIGQPSAPPAGGDGRTVTFVQEGGQVVAALVHDAVLASDPGRVDVAVTLAGLAVGNARLHALALARVEDVARSTAALATATEDARAELTAQLASGPCRELVELHHLAGELPERSPEAARAGLRQLHDGLRGVVNELRAIAHRAYAPALDHGLAVALPELAKQATRRVELPRVEPVRFAPATELTAYLAVASEARDEATDLEVELSRTSGELVLRLDGALGPPDAMVSARVAALDGSIADDDAGRTIRLPLADRPATMPG
jgi:hypothetical protein